MDKYVIEITKPAENDLLGIGRYIAEELLEPVIAKNTIGKIADVIFTLETLPQRNNLVSDERLALLGIRRILVENFIVFYTINEKEKVVTIVRVLYSKRDWLNLL